MKYLFSLIFFTTILFSHNLQHTISKEKSIVVSFSFAQEDDFSFQSYEVYAPNTEIPFAVGRTDTLSRLSFLPNAKGSWRVKVFSQDGHGKIVNVEVDENIEAKIETNSSNTLLKALIGIMLLFGVFGFIYIKKDKKNEKN